MSRTYQGHDRLRTEVAMPDKAIRIEKLRAIERLVDEARMIADDEGEHLLGAKLDDCATCALQRMESLRG
jgi:hypothetical protein